MEQRLLSQETAKTDVLVIGGGPSGLMAATELSRYSCKIIVIDSMPTLGRKFLMAGKSGLNITTSKTDFLKQYGDSEDWITPMINRFGPKEIIKFCQDLGHEIFFGSSGKVFPISMKTSPLLRSWLANLKKSGVTLETSSRWIDFNDRSKALDEGGWRHHIIKKSDVTYMVASRATILAMGGASWARLGSDGKWLNILQKYIDNSKKALISFSPSNMGLKINWSENMLRFEGHPVKSIALKINGKFQKGEFFITRTGVEGNIIYLLATAHLKQITELDLDLLPDLSIGRIAEKLNRNRRKSSWANFLRKSLGLTGVKFNLIRESGYSFTDNRFEFAKTLKNLRIKVQANNPIDYAISTKGGVAKNSVNDQLMLTDLPGVFCVGEMLDWTAPTGGCLLTGCFSTGSHVGKSVAQYLNLKMIP